MRSTTSGAMIAHSSTCIAPIEPPTTAARRSIPIALGERELRAHLVADREEREARAPLHPVGGERRGTRRPLASADHVRGDHEVPVGVDREPGTHDAGPPARAGVGRTGGADDVAVARERVQHEHHVVAARRARAPRLVGDVHVGQRAARVEGHVADRRRTGGRPPGRPRARPRSPAPGPAGPARAPPRRCPRAPRRRWSASPCLDSPEPCGPCMRLLRRCRR